MREDTIARLAVTSSRSCSNRGNPRSIEQIAHKVVQALSQPFELGGHHLHIGTSVGISLYPDDGDDATALIKHADAAMYQAKASGRNNYQFYSAALSTRTSERVHSKDGCTGRSRTRSSCCTTSRSSPPTDGSSVSRP